MGKSWVSCFFSDSQCRCHQQIRPLTMMSFTDNMFDLLWRNFQSPRTKFHRKYPNFWRYWNFQSLHAKNKLDSSCHFYTIPECDRQTDNDSKYHDSMVLHDKNRSMFSCSHKLWRKIKGLFFYSVYVLTSTITVTSYYFRKMRTPILLTDSCVLSATDEDTAHSVKQFH